MGGQFRSGTAASVRGTADWGQRRPPPPPPPRAPPPPRLPPPPPPRLPPLYDDGLPLLRLTDPRLLEFRAADPLLPAPENAFPVALLPRFDGDGLADAALPPPVRLNELALAELAPAEA